MGDHTTLLGLPELPGLVNEAIAAVLLQLLCNTDVGKTGTELVVTQMGLDVIVPVQDETTAWKQVLLVSGRVP